jgi:Rap1a immunity proteins
MRVALFIFVLLFAIGTKPAIAEAGDLDPSTGLNLLKSCQKLVQQVPPREILWRDDKGYGAGYCVGYIAGNLDMAHRADEVSGSDFCAPSATKPAGQPFEIARVLVKYLEKLEKHPERLLESGSGFLLFYAALREAFPCSEPTGK